MWREVANVIYGSNYEIEVNLKKILNMTKIFLFFVKIHSEKMRTPNNVNFRVEKSSKAELYCEYTEIELCFKRSDYLNIRLDIPYRLRPQAIWS